MAALQPGVSDSSIDKVIQFFIMGRGDGRSRRIAGSSSSSPPRDPNLLAQSPIRVRTILRSAFRTPYRAINSLLPVVYTLHLDPPKSLDYCFRMFALAD